MEQDIPDDPTLGRVCSKCQTWKPAENFRAQPRGRGGLHSICRPCGAAYMRAKYRVDPEPARKAARDWHKNNPERAKERRRAWTLKANYGITPEEFEAMFDGQGRSCAACGGREPNGINWHVDHNHETNVIRGILCHPCNTAIGLTRESQERLSRLASYLLRHTDVLAAAVDDDPQSGQEKTVA